MSGLTIDEKMLLVQKMRSQSEKNDADHMYIRKRFSEAQNTRTSSDNLYNDNRNEWADGIQEGSGGLSYLKLRIFVCIFVFAVFFSLYQTKFNFMGHQAEEIQTVLQDNILPKKLQNSLETLSGQIVKQ